MLFAGPEGGFGYIVPITKTFTANDQFGLSMLSPGPHRYFTKTFINPDGEQHAKVYQNLDDPQMFLIGFENLYGAGDRDYNDLVFSVRADLNSVGGIEVFSSDSAAVARLAYYAILAIFGTAASLVRRKKQF